MKKRFCSLLLCFSLLASLLPSALAAGAAPIFQNGTDLTQGLPTDQARYTVTGSGTAVTATFEKAWNAVAEKGGSISLIKDVTAANGSFGTGAGFTYGMVTVPAGKTIKLNLQGHTLNRGLAAPSANGSVIVVRPGAELTVDGKGTDARGNDVTGAASMANGKITGGNAGTYGGGIANYGILTVRRAVVDGNKASNGGGIYSTGTLTLNGSTVSHNTASNGGGIYTAGAARLNGTVVTANTATKGGGVYSANRTEIAGALKVDANTGGNLYLASGAPALVSTGLADGAKIGVSTAAVPAAGGTVTAAEGTIAAADTARFASDITGVSVAQENGKIVLKGTAAMKTALTQQAQQQALSTNQSSSVTSSGVKVINVADGSIMTTADGDDPDTGSVDVTFHSAYPGSGQDITVTISKAKGDDWLPYFSEFQGKMSESATDGFKFVGWRIGGTPYKERDQVTYTTETHVYARWEPLIEYTVTVKPGEGGTEPDVILDPKPQEGTAYTPAKQTKLPAKNLFKEPAGKKFRAWEIDGGEYPAESMYKFTKDTTVTALWDSYQYTIRYENISGADNKNNRTAYEISDKEIAIANPEKPGFTFEGWTESEQLNIENPAKDVKIPAGTIGDLIFTAHWNVNVHTLTLVDKDGSTIGTKNDVAVGESVDLSQYKPQKDGYELKEWISSDTSDSQSPYSPTAFYIMPDKDIILTADWAELCTVEFDLNGGTGQNIDDIQVRKNENTTLPTLEKLLGDLGVLYPPAGKEGYIFAGWAVGSPTSNTKIADGGSYKFDQAHTILYAVWEDANTYNITFYNSEEDKENGVSLGRPMPVKVGDPADLSTKLKEITIPAGYMLDHWHDDEQTDPDKGNYSPTAPDSVFTMPGRNIDLIAVYKAIEYDIKYQSEDGKITYNTLTPSSFTVEDLPVPLPVPPASTSGQDFLGWTGPGVGEIPAVKAEIPENIGLNNATTFTYTAHWGYPAEYTRPGGQTVSGSFEDMWNEAAKSGGTVKLNMDITAGSSGFGTGAGFDNNGNIIVPANRNITLNLAGQILDRNARTGSHPVIYVSQSGTLTINNSGTITGGTQGGIVNHGTLNFSGAEVSGNDGTIGGGIYNDGTLNMSGGTITGNSATGNGGGIYNEGTLNLSGGSISANTANGQGDGIYQAGGEFNLSSGSPSIMGNSGENNVYLPDGEKIQITASLAYNGAEPKIGVTTEKTPTDGNDIVIAEGKGSYTIVHNEDNKIFLSDRNIYYVGSAGNTILLQSKETDPHVTVTYMPNNGTSDEPFVDNVSVGNKNYRLRRESDVNFTRPEGMSLSGWSLNPEGGTVQQQNWPCQPDRNLVYYAVWAVDRSIQYTITYELGAGVAGEPPQSEQWTAGTLVRLPGTTVTNGDATFAGWKTAGDENRYPAGFNYEMPGRDVTFVAQWSKLESLTVSTQPTKMNYLAGQKLDLTGLKVTAKFTDGTTFDFTHDQVDCSPAHDYQLQRGDNGRKIRVSYGGMTAETNAMNVEPRYSISGKVTYRDKPADGAEITYKIKGSETHAYHATADENGNYTLTGLLPGEYEISYRKSQVTTTITVVVSENDVVQDVTIVNKKNSDGSSGSNNNSSSNGNDSNNGNKDDKDKIVITASAGSGGRISPSGDVLVDYGDDQRFRITPRDGYEVEDVIVDGKSEGAVTSYTFDRVRREHTIRVRFTEEGSSTTNGSSGTVVYPNSPTAYPNGSYPSAAVVTPSTGGVPSPYYACLRDSACPIAAFNDATANAWYHDGVHYCLYNGLMNGISNNQFAPTAPLSRGMLAQILYNREGKPLTSGGTRFSDVAAGTWYENAIQHASATGIVAGYENGAFGPDDPVTREQLVVVLWRYAGSPSVWIEMPFPDFADTREYARDAMRWAVASGIISGKENGRLDPSGRASRAEVAQMLKNYLENA